LSLSSIKTPALWIGLLSALLLPLAVVGQTVAAPTGEQPAETTPQQPVSLPEQRVGPGDLIALAVANCPELTRNFRVAHDGSLPLPLLKQRIQAGGKEPAEIEVALSEALRQEQILVNPVVSASVVEYRSVPVSIMGAVRHPITFQAVGNVTLLDALAKAEGLLPEAGPEILISQLRTAKDAGPVLPRHIPVHGLIDDADPNLNVRLYGGEEIRIPPAGKVYVVGNVKKSGAFPIQEGNDTTVLKAIALSEGLLPYSGKEAYIYRREAGATGRSEIPVALSKIMDRKSADVHLQPNDILYIPDSKGRKITAQTLDRIAGFGSATGSGLLIWH
jgi:polysaccharide export outer membrane protein